MKKLLRISVAIFFLSFFGVAQADAEDRFFQIQVKLIAGGQSPFFAPPDTPGPNCYSFFEDGTWIDPLFPNPVGIWESDPNGAVTRYTAAADFPGGFGLPPLLLVQEGQITPTTGDGQVRLHAFSTVFLGGTDVVLAEFMSTGHEVDECP